MLNVTSAICHEQAHSALVTLERFAVRLSIQIPVSWKKTYMSQWHSHSKLLYVDACQNRYQTSSAWTQTSPFLFHWGIWTLTMKYNSDLSVRQGLFLLRETRQIHILTSPSTAEQLAIFPYTFCTDPRTPREMFCSFVFTSPTFVLRTLKPTVLPIHAVMAGKRLTDIFITKDHHAWVEACFPTSTWTEVSGVCVN